MNRNKRRPVNTDPGVRLHLDDKTVTSDGGYNYSINTMDDMGTYRTLMAENKLNPMHAASIITGTIRNIYTNGLLTDDEIKAVPVLRYMDEIAFDDIRHVIGSMYIYGSSEQMRGIVIKILQNVSETVGYEMSPESLKKISEIINKI